MYTKGTRFFQNFKIYGFRKWWFKMKKNVLSRNSTKWLMFYTWFWKKLKFLVFTLYDFMLRAQCYMPWKTFIELYMIYIKFYNETEHLIYCWLHLGGKLAKGPKRVPKGPRSKRVILNHYLRNTSFVCWRGCHPPLHLFEDKLFNNFRNPIKIFFEDFHSLTFR